MALTPVLNLVSMKIYYSAVFSPVLVYFVMFLKGFSTAMCNVIFISTDFSIEYGHTYKHVWSKVYKHI